MRNPLLSLPEVIDDALSMLQGSGVGVGQTFTLPGCGWGSRGQEVINDWNPKTKRRCKCVKRRHYVVTGEVKL